MMDLLVSMAVIAVLVSLISPTLAHVRNAANKVVCASNLRQVGLGLSMYQDDHNTMLPQERRFVGRSLTGAVDPQIAHTGESPESWSGLGYLVSDGYLTATQVFYCPAHDGAHTHDAYSERWMMLDAPIRTNYAYRGSLAGQDFELTAPSLDGRAAPPPSTVLVSDAFTSLEDISHDSGFNLLSYELSVTWLYDRGAEVRSLVAEAGQAGVDADRAWSILDRENETPSVDPGVEAPTTYQRLYDPE